MQKSNSIARITRLFSPIGVVDLMLVVVLLFSNAFFALQNSEEIKQISQLLPHLNVTNVMIVGSILTTIFSLVLNYNVLKVMFSFSGVDFAKEDILLVYLLSSLLANSSVYFMTSFFVVRYYVYAITVNSLYSVFVFVLVNLRLWQKFVVLNVNRQLAIKLNLFLIGYCLLNALITFLSVDIDV